MSLKEVKYARVHLVMPESGLFKRGNTAASASVTLFLQNGNSPSGEQIAGIQRLISAAVSGLSASQVTVTDQNGITLSRHVAEDEGMEAVSARLQQKKAVEQYLAGKAMAIMKSAFDSDRLMVSVDASIDYNQVSTTKESVLPSDSGAGGGIVRRRESKFGSGSGPGGSEGNVTTEVEYQLGRSVAQIVETPGKILRLSVGVLVPDTTTEERREQIKQLVSVAIGIDVSRGDAVVVHPVDPLAVQLPQEVSGEASPGYGWNDSELLAKNAISDASVKRSTLKSWLPGYLDNHFLLVGIIMLAIIAALFFLFIRLFPGSQNTNSVSQSLSAQERDRILARLNSWLEAETAIPGENEAGSQ